MQIYPITHQYRPENATEKRANKKSGPWEATLTSEENSPVEEDYWG